MPVQFAASSAVLLALGVALAALLAWYVRVSRYSLSDMSARRRRLALVLRCLLTILVFGALAGARWVRASDGITVVFVVDRSRSLQEDQARAADRFLGDAAAARRSGDRVGVVSFGAAPRVDALPAPAQPGVPRSTTTPNGTDLAAALETALSLIPASSAGKVVVLSDGNENAGSALSTAPSAAARGVRVDTVPFPSSLRQEALIERLDLPASAKVGEPFGVRVVTNSLATVKGQLVLLQDGRVVAGPRNVTVARGRQVHDFEASGVTAGVHRYEAQLLLGPALDTLAENSRGAGCVMVRGRPQVLYVSRTPEAAGYLKRALAPQSIDVRYAPPDAMPTAPAALLAFDSVLWSDAPSSDFSSHQLDAIRATVRDLGVGFGMIGGERSFGTGGYRKTPVEEMLPVSLDVRRKQRIRPICVGLALDHSGSMAEGGPPRRKMDYAKDAAARAVTLLGPADEVAVIAFDAVARVVMPVVSAQRQSEVVGAIGAIEADGGTSVWSGVSLTFDTLRGQRDYRRHIIILTDGMSNAREDYRPLAAEMRREKVSLTAVIVAAGSGDAFGGDLGWLARETGGRVYWVERPADIPAIYMQEIERVASRPLVEEPFTPRVTPLGAEQSPVLAGGPVPLLLGYNVTEPKPTADVLLASHRADPILARWRYGLGRSFAFTSDDRNRWAAHWLAWPEYPRFWAETVRWTLRSAASTALQASIAQDGGRARVVVDAIGRSGEFLNGLQLAARLVSPDSGGPATPIALRQSGPGRYEGVFDASQIGTYVASVSQVGPGADRSSATAALAVPYSPEYRELANNDLVLRELARSTGGSVLWRPEQVFRENRPVSYASCELAQPLLLIAMLLLPLDIGVRRLNLQREDLARALAALRARRSHKRGAATPELGRLMAAKRRSAPAPRAQVAPVSARDVADNHAPAPAAAPPRGSAPPARGPQAPEGARGLDRLMAAKNRARKGAARQQDDAKDDPA